MIKRVSCVFRPLLCSSKSRKLVAKVASNSCYTNEEDVKTVKTTILKSAHKFLAKEILNDASVPNEIHIFRLLQS